MIVMIHAMPTTNIDIVHPPKCYGNVLFCENSTIAQ